MASSGAQAAAPGGGQGMMGMMSPGGAGPGQPGAPGAVDPQTEARIAEFHRNSLRGNREGRAYTPGQARMIEQGMRQDAMGGGGGGGMRDVITPGGGNQNAFSPQAATVTQVPGGGGGGGNATLRAMLAAMMGGRPSKFSGTGDRAGYGSSGPSSGGGRLA